MIHCKDKNPKELFEFCNRFSDFEHKVPLVAVPSSYPQIREEELVAANIQIVIYANHLLRSAYPSMIRTAESILKNGCSASASKKYCMPVSEILRLIPEHY